MAAAQELALPKASVDADEDRPFSFMADGDELASDAPDDEGDEPTASAPPASSSGKTAKANAANAEKTSSDICECCENSPKAQRCRYGPECKKALNNITQDMKKRSKNASAESQVAKEQEEFNVICKEAGARLHALMLSYRRKSDASVKQGKRRNSSFNFTQELEELRVEQEVALGAKLVYMNYQRWCKVAKSKHGMSVQDADRQWNETMQSTSKRLRRGSAEDPRLPMPDEEYISAEQKQIHAKSIVLSNKAEKNKDLDASIAGRSKGHFGANDKFFSATGGEVIADSARSGGIDFKMSSESAGSQDRLKAIQDKGQPAAGQDGKPDEKEKKRKRYDIMAAHNRCRDKLVSEWNKMCETVSANLVDGTKLLEEHKKSGDYQGYLETIEHRTALMRGVSAKPQSAAAAATAGNMSDLTEFLKSVVDVVPAEILEQCKLTCDVMTCYKDRSILRRESLIVLSQSPKLPQLPQLSQTVCPNLNPSRSHRQRTT